MRFMKISFFVGLALISAIVAGCGGGGGGGFVKEISTVGQTGTVSGKLATPAAARVYANAIALVPLVDAVVSCGERQSITDSEGAFRITLVPTGLNYCTAVKTGYNLIEFTVDVAAKTTTSIPSNIPVYKKGEFQVSVTPAKTSGTTADSYKVTCDVVGGRAETIDIKCGSSLAYSSAGSKASTAFKICSYSVPGEYTPSCKVDSSVTGASAAAITVTGSPTVSVAASVNPTSGTVNDVYQLTCVPSGTTPFSLEGRCSDASSWSGITTGYSMNCSYSAAGSYRMACRVDKSDVIAYAPNVTVSIAPLTVTASVTPSSGLIVDTYVLSCVANGTPATLEAKCDKNDASWSSLTISTRTGTKNCSYTSTGTYTPTCRVNSDATDDVDAPVTVSMPKVIAFSPANGATNVQNSSTPFSVTFDYSMDNTVNLNTPTILAASGFAITIQNDTTGALLTINSSNALSYGSFAWIKTTLTNDTLKYSLKSNSTLIANGLEPMGALQKYNIIARTVPTNLKESRGAAIDTTTNIPTTGSFTTR